MPALEEIRKFAFDYCAVVPPSGNTTSWKTITVPKVDSLVNKLATLGSKPAVEIRGTSYEGVLQRDLAPLLKSELGCRIDVLRLLKDRLLSPEMSGEIPERIVLRPGNNRTQDTRCDARFAEAAQYVPNYRPPEKGLQIMLGTNTFLARKDSNFVALAIRNEPAIWVTLDGNGLPGIHARVARPDGRIAVTISDNVVVVERKFFFRVNFGPHHLQVVDEEDEQVLLVEYLSERTLRIQARMHVEGRKTPLRIGEETIRGAGVLPMADNCSYAPVGLSI